jgi:hypothetical protein
MIIPLFILWVFIHGMACPRNNKNPCCVRTEFYGFSYSHLLFFILLGYLYPNDMVKYLTLAFLFELVEYWLTKNPNIVEKLGGYLSTAKHQESPLWFRKVYGNEKKYENFIDRSLGIESPTDHTWHFSLGENVTNVLGFLIGQYISKNLKFVPYVSQR